MGFSDQGKGLRIILGLTALLSLCVYGWLEGPRRSVNMRKITADPGRYAHRSVAFQGLRVDRPRRDGFEFVEGHRRFRARYSGREPAAWPAGEWISVRGTVREGVLYFERYHHHRHRRIKIVTSVLALLAVGVYLIRRRVPLPPSGRRR